MSQCLRKPLARKEKPQQSYYDIQLIEKFQRDSIAWDQSKHNWAFDVVDEQTVIHTISFEATRGTDSTKYDEYTGENLLRIPQTVDQKKLLNRVTKLLSRLSDTPAYSKLIPHVAFYIHLKNELSILRIPMQETKLGKKLSRSGTEVIATAEETNVLVRKSRPVRADAQTLPVRTSKESDRKEKEKRPEHKKPEKQQASAGSQSEARTKPSTGRGNDHSPRRDSDRVAGPSNTKEKVIDSDEGRPTADPSNHNSSRISKDLHAKLLKGLQMTPCVPTESSSTSSKDDSRRTESQKHGNASKPRRRDLWEGSEDEGHSSSGESNKKKERKRRGDKA